MKHERRRKSYESNRGLARDEYAVLEDGGVLLRRSGESWVSFVVKNRIQSPQTVSYTHLDVYKRQIRT